MMRSSSSRLLCCVETIHATSGSRPTAGQSMPINSTQSTPRNVLPARRSLKQLRDGLRMWTCSRNASTRSAAAQRRLDLRLHQVHNHWLRGPHALTVYVLAPVVASARPRRHLLPPALPRAGWHCPRPRSVRAAVAPALAPTTSLATG